MFTDLNSLPSTSGGGGSYKKVKEIRFNSKDVKTDHIDELLSSPESPKSVLAAFPIQHAASILRILKASRKCECLKPAFPST